MSVAMARLRDRAIGWRLKRNGDVLARHAALARRAGIDRVYLILSCDCDTAEDAEVAWQMHSRLGELGVLPVYAVPGALLERAADTYTRIAATGAEFLNHGGAEHTYFDEKHGRHASCFFYDELSPELVRQDVLDGDRIVTEVLGRRPQGFRTPHFGTYAKPRQLRHLHLVLKELGYRFSTSTTPGFGLRHGPVSDHLGLVELPVTGAPDAPLQILDTWGFFAAPDRTRTPAEYLGQARVLAKGLAAEGAGVINVYCDPVHIHDRTEFYEAVRAWTEVAEPVSYGEVLDPLGR
jgi:hypothetical protein